MDVSEISKKFGGGGHKKAAGFTLPGDAQVDDIFDIEEDVTEEEDNLHPEEEKEQPPKKAKGKGKEQKGEKTSNSSSK